MGGCGRVSEKILSGETDMQIHGNKCNACKSDHYGH